MNRPLVPYVTSWSTETERHGILIQDPPSGIRYADESVADRDDNGVLWSRIPLLQGEGRPLFGQVHALRQRRAMRHLRCQVCAGPADRTEHGILWMLQDKRDGRPDWPEDLDATEPPICRPCADISRVACPALRAGHVTVRVKHSPVTGVLGIQYTPGPLLPEPTTAAIVDLDDPAIGWTLAAQLVRRLRGCTLVEPTH